MDTLTNTAASDSRRPQPLPFAELQEAFSQQLASGDNGAMLFVDTCLAQALLHRVSDIHIDPWDDAVSVHYRIDGMLHEVARLPREHHAQIAGRIKVLARILTYQKDTPQDGRIEPDGTPCGKAVRVSTLPTVSGEKLVLRLLDATGRVLELDTLGFPRPMTDMLRGLALRPQGTLLLTGPASSGKTTTIYALLREILDARAPSVHAVTIEDPVECRIGRVVQTQVNHHTGYTFAAALRAVLRQDPEVIVVGEIRDAETARIAIQAGLTGHLVISTIHSGTAAGVFTRLLDMGVEPYLVASSVTGVLAQRLLRRNCPACATDYIPDHALAARYGLAGDDGAGTPPAALRRGLGCPHCNGIGYHGRMATGELLQVNETIAQLVLGRTRTPLIHEAALQAGLKPMAADAVERVRTGLTTLDEVRRVLPAPEDTLDA